MSEYFNLFINSFKIQTKFIDPSCTVVNYTTKLGINNNDMVWKLFAIKTHWWSDIKMSSIQ